MSNQDQDEFEKGLSDLGGDEGQSLESLFGEEADNPLAPGLNDKKGPRDLTMFSKIPVKLTLEVDSVDVMLGDLLNLTPGEVLPLDKTTGEPLDVRVNGQLLARAEVVVVDGRYGLRLTEIVDDITVPRTRK
jgi:flagellar motor switch protein FliN/FliY